MNNQPQAISIEEMAKKFLTPKLEKSFTKVNLEVREMSLNVEMDKFRVRFQVRGLGLAIAFVAISIASVVVSICIVGYLLTTY